MDHEFAEKECIIKEKEAWADEDLGSKRVGRGERGIWISSISLRDPTCPSVRLPQMREEVISSLCRKVMSRRIGWGAWRSGSKKMPVWTASTESTVQRLETMIYHSLYGRLQWFLVGSPH